ncbi:flavodoxin domain-containing protein [Streptomyces sp. NPDC006997]|uniref:flavodoxin domain-containing protein n=1 Tax=Streptomyces sp. NPDC006997 TaxID=3155356 RepID=UPI0033E62056
MDGKVLVAYGTTNGSTARIAETVAEVLNREGVPAEARPARSVSDAAAYDAVVVGGALYSGRWHKDARRFVRRHRGELAGRPVWFFSSGPLDASASEREIPPVPRVKRAMTELNVAGHATFGGRLEEGARGRVAGMILRSGKGGDFLDPTAVESWATTIAKDLTRKGKTT